MAYKQYKLKVKIGEEVKDKNGVTNFGAISMNNSKAYCLKTNKDNNKSILFRFRHYKNSSNGVTTATIENKLVHGNGSTFYKGNLWIATGTDKIVKIIPEKSLSKTYEYKYRDKDKDKDKDEYEISAISYYKNNKFIVKTKKIDNGKRIEYRIIKFEGTPPVYFIDDSEPKIQVNNVKAKNEYTILQDIFYNYKTNLLYIIVCKKSILNENAILVVNLAGKYAGTKDNRIYTPDKVLIVKEKNYEKFELESMDLMPNGKFIMACNIEKGNAQKDAMVYEISRKLLS